jgi:hypothetical protein
MTRTMMTIGSIVAVAGAAWAANGIDVKPGPDATVYGSCVPSMLVENKSAVTVDFLQVDLAVTLRNGQERVIELRSGYRGGIDRPIVPGATATLKQQLDLGPALGVGCGEVAARRINRTICEAGGTTCASSVSVKP